jgi:NAD(P)-dependent dehydrogenase (short-subunit alcohol dehydrogenase family)
VRDLFRLDDRVAVVTGALGLLGPVWAEGLLEAGASVLGVDRPEAKMTDRFLRLQDRYGEKRLGLYRADVCDRRALIKARGFCLSEFGPPAILVNNAGIDQPPGKLKKSYRMEDVPVELSRAIFEVNVLGLFQSAQIFGAAMLKAKRGSIINIGSVYATVSPDLRFYDHIPSDPPFLKPPAYGASKAAVVNLTQYLATAWASQNVRVNALSPGGVKGGQDEKFIRKFSSRVPLGRMAADRDLIGPLLFLASDASSYVTGANLKVDGGYTVW